MSQVAETFVQQLVNWGVTSVYGVAGDTILPFLDALTRNREITFVPVRHEENAAFMASAHAKLTGKLGVCIATSGPGAVHLMNGLGDALNDRAPVLAITGQVPSDNLGTDYKQYIDDQSLFRALSEFSVRLGHPEATVPLLHKAIITSLSRGSVAHISVPKDLWSQEANTVPWPAAPYLNTCSRSSSEVIRQGAELLKQFQKPVLLIGRGGRSAGNDIISLAEKLGAGIITTMPAKGVIPWDFSLMLGGLGDGGSEASSELLHECDGIVIIGATWWPEKYVPTNKQIIQLDISPVNIGAKTPVSYGIVGDIQYLVGELNALLSPKGQTPWRHRVEQAKQNWSKIIEHEVNLPGYPIAPQKFMNQLEKQLAEDAIICIDTGEHSLWFNRIFKGARQEVLVSGNWRSMGFALPAAIAAKLNKPPQQVVAIVGDGGMTMGLGELLTAVNLNLNLTVLVINNQSLALEENHMLALGLNPNGVQLKNMDFTLFAQACGAVGMKVEREEALADTLSRALATKGPVLVDVPCQVMMVPTIAEKP